MRIVRWVLNPSLREASCWSVEVVNGAVGLRLRCFLSIFETRTLPPAAAITASRAACAVVSFSKVNCSTLSPRYSASRALNTASPLVTSPSSVQYSRGTKASTSSSRSTIMRSAGLCTRPAESFGMIFFHSSGDRLKPNR